MKIISKKRCIIGEGPIWNEKEKLLYFVNPYEEQICKLDIYSGELDVIEGIRAYAVAFDANYRMIISSEKGVYYLNEDNSQELIFSLNAGNDMKVGPDGKIYVGTQSSKRLGISENADSKLYSIGKDGSTRVLLDGMLLSNGMGWSMDERRFYHTDSDTGIIKEYDFDKATGNISFTGRSVSVTGIDGFTIGENNHIYAACWGHGHIAVIDTADMHIKSYILVPAKIPASCAFCGQNMDKLIVVTAMLGSNIRTDENAGFTFIKEMDIIGRKPYLFGEKR